jgi:hypothetical protein
VEFSNYGVSLLEIQLIEVPGRNMGWHRHACHLLQFAGQFSFLDDLTQVGCCVVDASQRTGELLVLLQILDHRVLHCA